MKDKIKDHIVLIYISMSIFAIIAITCMIFDIVTRLRYQPLTILISVISISIVCITDILACIAELADVKKISDEVVRGIAEDHAINKCILRLLVKVIIIVLQISNLLFK